MASKNVHEFTEANWQAEVASSTEPVLVDFWAPWCGPCRALTPVIDEVADKFAGRVKVGKVNTDENQDLASTHGINAIPRLMIFKDGKQVWNHTGTLPAGELSKALESVLA